MCICTSALFFVRSNRFALLRSRYTFPGLIWTTYTYVLLSAMCVGKILSCSWRQVETETEKVKARSPPSSRRKEWKRERKKKRRKRKKVYFRLLRTNFPPSLVSNSQPAGCCPQMHSRPSFFRSLGRSRRRQRSLTPSSPHNSSVGRGGRGITLFAQTKEQQQQ